MGSVRCRGNLEPVLAVAPLWHVRSCDRWTWMIEIAAQTITKWNGNGVSVWRRNRTQCSGSGNRSVTKKDRNYSHRSVGSCRCRGCLDPAAAVELWQHVTSCDRWTWMIELLAQTMTKWYAYGVSVWRRSQTQCSGSGNRSVTKKDWNFSHRPVGSGRSMGSLDPAADVVLWQHVRSCDRWT